MKYKIAHFSLCFCLIFVASLDSTAEAKQEKSPDPKKIIGLEIIGSNYPDGWSQIAADGFGQSPFVIATIKNKKRYAVILKKRRLEPQKGQDAVASVTDAISVNDPTSLFKFSRLCYFDGEESQKAESNIIANVGFTRYCDLKTKLIKNAWKINLNTGKFDPILQKNKLTCEYGFVSLGDRDFRDGCPDY